MGADELQGPGSAQQNREAIIAGGKGDELRTPSPLATNVWLSAEQGYVGGDRRTDEALGLNMAGSYRQEGRR